MPLTTAPFSEIPVHDTFRDVENDEFFLKLPDQFKVDKEGNIFHINAQDILGEAFYTFEPSEMVEVRK